MRQTTYAAVSIIFLYTQFPTTETADKKKLKLGERNS
nr:MAG TPA: hypothetical protein [Herelleviridae sp.]